MTRTAILTATTLAFVIVAGAVFGSVGLATTATAQESSGSIEGDVTTDEGIPLPGASVTVENASGAVVAETTTDDAGEYNVSGLAPGEYTVVAESDGVTGRSSAPVESGSTTVVGILLVGADPPESEEPGAIEGDVTTGDGTPLPGASVTVESDSGTVVAETTTDDSGGYSVTELPPGEYTVVAESDGATGRSTATVEPGNTTVSGILLFDADPPGSEESGTIRGDVTTGEGTPLPGASVTVENASGAVVAETTTDDSGGYSVTELPPGEYTVVAESDGVTGRSIAPVESGSTTVVGILLVGADPPAPEEPGAIEGDVTTGDGTPLPGASVTVENASGAVVAETTTDSSGGYSVTELPPGEYTVVAERDGATGRSTATVESGNTTVSGILLFDADPPESGEPGAIRGAVIEREQLDPVPGASVTVESASGAVVAETTTDDSGAYNVSGLAPGEYTVVAERDDATGELFTRVASGTTTAADVLIEDADPPAELSPDRELNATSVAPGGATTVTVEVDAHGDAVSLEESVSPDVESVSIESVTVDGASAPTIVDVADSTGVLVTLGDVDAGQTVAVTYTVTVPETADNGTTYTIDGTVTSDGEASIEQSELTVRGESQLSGIVGEYDTDADGEISLTEMSQAARDYSNDDISLDELRDVATAYAES